LDSWTRAISSPSASCNAGDQTIAIAKWLPNRKLQEQFAGYLAKQKESGNGLSASAVESMTKRHADAGQPRAGEQDDVFQ
jgi:hypothetical protein